MSATLVAGHLTTLAEGVKRLIAPNPGMMTGPGTNSYVIGNAAMAVIDPGPDIEVHLDALARTGDIRWILVSHTHPDHSPGTCRLARLTGAQVIGVPAPQGPHQDRTFSPDRIPQDGEILSGPDFEIEMLYTPGHASNHICFLHKGYRWLFTGDHVMSGSTVVIDPPDGDMQAYLSSLRQLRNRDIDAIVPGHGDLIEQPQQVIDWIVEHRLAREGKVLDALAGHPDSSSHELVPYVYRDVGEHLHGWAERSLLAHLIKLEKDGRAVQQDGRWQAIEA